MKLRLILFLSTIFILFGCKKTEKRDESRVPLLEVEGQYLYQDEVESVIQPGSSKKDSISVANDYIKKWVTEALVYEHAENNISNQDEIDELVEDYRKSLVIHQYQQNLIKERLGEGPSEDQMQSFFEANKDKFILTENVIKGVYMKVPKGAPKLAVLQGWMRSFNAKSLEKIEKYSIQNATSYEYFGNKWVLFNEVANNMPLQVENQSEFIARNPYIQLADSNYMYALRILDYKLAGAVEPYEMAKDRIKLLMMNKLKNDYIKTFEKKLYDDAVKDKKINYFKVEK